MDSPQIDSTLVKMILTSIKEGDLTAIKNKLAQYNIDLRLLKDVYLNNIVVSMLPKLF